MLMPLAQALIAANRERVLWGTDWPHADSSRVPAAAPLTLHRCSKLMMVVYSTSFRCGLRMRMCAGRSWWRTLQDFTTFELPSIRAIAA